MLKASIARLHRVSSYHLSNKMTVYLNIGNLDLIGNLRSRKFDQVFAVIVHAQESANLSTNKR